MEKGTVVKSLAGRDKGRLLAVMQSENGSVLVCDGKERPIDRPKSKNIRHVECVGLSVTENDMRTNKALKKALRQLMQN
ncbi:MAG: KOW domain-containing RNA-binding protein [Clostridia bacterium]|nr:KOW domain-containing RNA-binding protein [Clostridia bacterium]